MGEAEVGLSVVITNVSDQAPEHRFVVRELSVFDILSDDVAKETAEVFVPREGKKRPGISQHSHKMG